MDEEKYLKNEKDVALEVMDYIPNLEGDDALTYVSLHVLAINNAREDTELKEIDFATVSDYLSEIDERFQVGDSFKRKI